MHCLGSLYGCHSGSTVLTWYLASATVCKDALQESNNSATVVYGVCLFVSPELLFIV